MTSPLTHDRRRVASSIAILVTRRCNMTCAHCSVESAPRVNTADPTEAELYRIIRESAAAGVRAVQFTGGEPMMRMQLVLDLMKEAHSLGMTSGITTNGFWGKNPRKARVTLREMIRHGLNYMAVSYDRYHAEFMGPEPILNLAEISREFGFFFNVNVTRTLADENLDSYNELFGNLPTVRMRLYDVQPVGRARTFEMPNLRAETEGFCNAAGQATFTEDGRMIACNGPAYFDPPENPRHVGVLADSSISELLEKHRSDPILDTIRTFGPAGLRDELKKVPEFAGAFERRFAGQCDLCQHITSNPAMVSHLREELSGSKHEALRLAKWSIINAARSSGQLTRDHANGPGFASLVFEKVTAGAWPAHAEKIFGRADIDWDHIARYLGGCGLAGRLAPAAVQAEISRWAPAYFGEHLNRRAMADALRELSHREALERIHDVLGKLGIRGVLLKGAALYLRERAAGITNGRIPGDIDMLVETRGDAEKLRRALIEEGFAGDPDATRTGPHHLAPVSWRSSTLEIHTGIMPGFWGLPERDMLADALPVGGWANYCTLSPSDSILHEAIHSTTHLFSHGLKLAMDVYRIDGLAKAERVAIDWDLIIKRAASTRCPNAFWVPVLALMKGMPGLLPVPDDLPARGPRGERMRRLNLIAYKRLFTIIDSADDMNPFTRNGIFLLMHDSTVNRIRYIAELTRGDAAESRRTAMGGGGGQGYKNLSAHLRNAVIDFKAYRRAVK